MIAVAVFVSLTIGCAAKVEKYDYSLFRGKSPRSILVVPVVNRSVDVDAPDYFLSTVARPIAERGYYVFPVNLTKGVLADDGLSDANLVHESDPTRLAEIFGADTVLYITIERWDARYAILSTKVTVEFSYALMDGSTGAELWRTKARMVYEPSQSNSGSPIADLVVQVISAAILKAAPNYIPLAQQANGLAVNRKHQGLPAGPYHSQHQQDQANF